MSLVTETLTRLTSNLPAQKTLEKVVQVSQFLQGISSGTDVNASGEKAVLEFVRHSFPPPHCIFDVGANQGQDLNLLTSVFPVTEVVIPLFRARQTNLCNTYFPYHAIASKRCAA